MLEPRGRIWPANSWAGSPTWPWDRITTHSTPPPIRGLGVWTCRRFRNADRSARSARARTGPMPRALAEIGHLQSLPIAASYDGRNTAQARLCRGLGWRIAAACCAARSDGNSRDLGPGQSNEIRWRKLELESALAGRYVHRLLLQRGLVHDDRQLLPLAKRRDAAAHVARLALGLGPVRQLGLAGPDCTRQRFLVEPALYGHYRADQIASVELRDQRLVHTAGVHAQRVGNCHAVVILARVDVVRVQLVAEARRLNGRDRRRSRHRACCPAAPGPRRLPRVHEGIPAVRRPLCRS